jgi:predicted glycogen debranching enzyme
MSAFEIPLPPAADDAGWRTREWRVCHGLGGYASGTLAGVCSRRYHGFFVPNLPEPRGRHVLVSRLDEQLSCGGRTWVLGGTDHAGKPLAVANAACLRAFRLDGNIACWTFECGDVTLERQLVMPHQRNTSYLRYEIVRGPDAVLRVRPFLPFRRQDAPLREPGYGDFQLAIGEDGACRVDLPGSGLWLAMRMLPDCAPFVPDPTEDAATRLWREELRGYAWQEAAASPGHFECTLAPRAPALLVFTTEESHPHTDIAAPFQQEQARMAQLLEQAGATSDPVLARLVTAADQFLILPQSRMQASAEASRRGHALRTVVAGYHWFLDWGRDTMISLEGLMLATGRHAEARATLLTFSQYVRDGLLPNLFPEGAEEGRYFTVDATLWYFHAIHRYVSASADRTLLDELMPVLRDIMRHHLQGTRYGIGVDPEDQLLHASTPGHALTWMDAHMGEWIVTPRRGKPVEIQALWYNALRLMAGWESTRAERSDYGRRADSAYASFNARYWNAGRSSLFDVVDGEEGDDPRIRPNQIFAIALDHPVLEPARWPAVLDTVRRELLTPFGLRTLERNDPQYCSNYHGNLQSRDAAYHQGTVWPWLLGAYMDAQIKNGLDVSGARALLAAFPAHLQVAGLGTLSEVFDGVRPHVPHGCIAQAWSVAEVLRCWKRANAGA